jgi:hypothetical protein
LDYENSADMMKELYAQPIMEFMQYYIANWKSHVFGILQLGAPF